MEPLTKKEIVTEIVLRIVQGLVIGLTMWAVYRFR